MSGLCGPCAAEAARWLDYRVPRGMRFTGSGAARDDTPRGVEERRRGRADDWAATIRAQRALIREACAAGRHAQRGRGDGMSDREEIPEAEFMEAAERGLVRWRDLLDRLADR